MKKKFFLVTILGLLLLTSAFTKPLPNQKQQTQDDGLLGTLQISENMALEVAKTYPRFATVIAHYIKGSSLYKQGAYYSSNFTISVQDAECVITHEETDPCVQDVMQRSRQAGKEIAAGRLKAVKYSYNTKLNSNTDGTFFLTVDDAGVGDPNYSTMEWKIIKDQDNKWKVVDWVIR